jgi:hypothetical protein
MAKYKVAHLKEQEQDMIIFPLASAFGNQPLSDQQEELAVLQARANAAGLGGSAVAIWQDSAGKTHFLGPTPWHGFLKGLSFRSALANVNKEISW